jgi:beta-glucosidase/6-phospho-beta-glucosidase/beta-galactosidase
LLNGFWIGGYEAADHVNGRGDALDLALATGHVDAIDEDHARAAAAGLAAVRESVGWRLSEPEPGRHDFSRAVAIEASARRHGLQVLWTLMHYGLPADLSLHDDRLVERFARWCAAAGRALGGGAGRPVFTPVNEIGYLAWAASMPHMLHPPNNCPEVDGETSAISGFAVKRRLVKAALAGVRALREVNPAALMLHVEPVVHVVPPLDRPELAEQAEQVASWQWQAWDLLSGRREPELGGSPEAIDLLGVNHYHSSQWELVTEKRLRWHEQCWRRALPARLLEAAWQRYGKPLIVAETSHVGIGRAAWLHDMAEQVRSARGRGVPVQGLTLYPLLDRPDWDEPAHWHRCGLWHVQGPDDLRRVPDPEYQRALHAWQAALPRHDGLSPPRLLAFVDARHGDARAPAWQRLRRLAGRWHVVAVEPVGDAGDGPDRVDVVPLGPWLQAWVPRSAGADADAAWRVVDDRWRSTAPEGAVCWLACEALASAALALGQRRWVVDRADERWPLDVAHFAAAPTGGWEADEAARLQMGIATPRIGCAGPLAAIDPVQLVAAATARPDLQFVLIGPGDAAGLPALANVHALGDVPYRLWPALMRGWQAAWRPVREDGPAAPAASTASGGVEPGATATWPTAPLLSAEEITAAGVPLLAWRDGRFEAVTDERTAPPAPGWDEAADALHARLLAAAAAPG